jgi:hypothetical protein
MFRLLSIIAVSSVAASPALAQTFRAENRVDVSEVSGGFAVKDGGGHGARGMWCAAADYARDVHGARGTQRIYVARDSAPLGRGPVVFTLSSAGLLPTRVTIVGGSVRVAGANLSVDHAHSFCADARVINR